MDRKLLGDPIYKYEQRYRIPIRVSLPNTEHRLEKSLHGPNICQMFIKPKLLPLVLRTFPPPGGGYGMRIYSISSLDCSIGIAVRKLGRRVFIKSPAPPSAGHPLLKGGFSKRDPVREVVLKSSKPYPSDP